MLGGRGRSHIDLAASLFDRSNRALGRAGDREGRLGGDLTLAEQTHAILAAAHQTGSAQRVLGDGRLGVELARVDELLHHADVHLGVVLAERVVEAALRQTHVERHLAAFEALDGNARTALLALLAACRGLALARADTTADTDAALAGTGIVTDVIQFHNRALAFAFVALSVPCGTDRTRSP